MFTGIVTATGTIRSISLGEGEGSFVFATGALDMTGVRKGDSIAVNGACLTVTEFSTDSFAADLSRETLACTTLGGLAEGAAVNLERALALGDALGGHLVTGHVDGVGEVASFEPDGDSRRLTIRVPDYLARYVAAKGSVCIDGVSLTVNTAEGSTIGMMIVPHTQAQTIMQGYGPGTPVNIEIDIIARYVERLVQYTGGSGKAG